MNEMNKKFFLKKILKIPPKINEMNKKFFHI